MLQAVTITVALATTALAQDIDPRGIYHNAFSGSFSGTEWFQVIPIPGTDRYQVADIFAGGFNATIDVSGAVVLDGGLGTGSFSTADDWIIRPRLGGTPFVFDNIRAPDTSVDFPLELESAAPANEILGGTYRSLTESLNPRTGLRIGGGVENVTVTADGQTFRITDPGGLFFQGTFESPLDIGFRVVTPTPSNPRYRTFSGSSINFAQNMLGRVTIEDVNTWSAIILLQSRTPLGSQTQSAFRFTATRVAPLPVGDLNGDRALGLTDRDLMLAQLGLGSLDDAFNVAADLDGDDAITTGDARTLYDLLGLCFVDLDGDGSLTIFDFLAFQNAFDDGNPVADFDGDGALTIFDFLAFQNEFDIGCP